MRKLVMLLPAFNEEAGLEQLVEKIVKATDQLDVELTIIVGNDGSTDRTGAIIEELSQRFPVRELRHTINRGLGETSRDLFEAAAEMTDDADIIMRMDGDDTHDPKYIAPLVTKLDEGYDVVITSRFRPGGDQLGVGVYRGVMSRCANTFMKVVFPIRGVRDYSCGYRAYRASIIKRAISEYGNAFIQLKGLGFTATLEKLVKLDLLGARFAEIPFVHRYDLKKSDSKMITSVTTLGYMTMSLLHYWPWSGWRKQYGHLQPGPATPDDDRVKRARDLGIPVMIGLVLLALAGALPFMASLDLHTALEGWSPLDYVQQRLSPESYVAQFPSGVLNYDSSIVMRGYLLVAMVTGVMPDVTMPISVVLEHIVFALGAALLAHALFARRSLTIVGVAVMLTCPIAGMNLANYHQFGLAGGPHGLFYLYAYGTMFAGIAAVLRGRLTLGGILLGATVWMHLLIGFYGAAFAGAAILAQPSLLKTRDVMSNGCIGSGVFLAIALPQVLMIGAGSSITPGAVPAEDWILATRTFSWHWYPSDLGQYTEMAHMFLVPLIALTALALHAGPRVVARREGVATLRMAMAGVVGCIVLTIAGLLIAEAAGSPTLIKLSLHRASLLVSVVTSLVVAAWLVQTIRTGSLPAVPFAAWGLAAMFLSSPGLALFPLLVVLGLEVSRGAIGSRSIGGSPRLAALAAVGTVLGVIVILVLLGRANTRSPIESYQALWTPLRHMSPWPWGQDDLALRGGHFMAGVHRTTFAVAVVLMMIALRPPMGSRVRLALVIVGGIAIVGFTRDWRDDAWETMNAARANSYKEVQLWARENTEPGSLFLTDPNLDYGWRDFADRPNTGSHREWGYAGYLYDTDPAVYETGMARLQRFGVDLPAMARTAVEQGTGMLELRAEIRQTITTRYQALDVEALHALSETWGFHYAVFRLAGHGPLRELPVEMQNDRFVVYRVRK